MDLYVKPAVAAAPLVVLALCLASLGVWVALDLARRAPFARRRDMAWRWIAGAAVAWAMGLWASQHLLSGVVGAAAAAGDAFRHPAWSAASSFVLSVALSGLALAILSLGQRNSASAPLASLLLGLAMVFCALCSLWGAGALGASAVAWLGVVAAAMCCGLVTMAALGWHVGSGATVGLGLNTRQSITAMSVGVGLVGSQTLLLLTASPLPMGALPATGVGVPASSLTVLAAVGCSAFLILMLISSQLESQLRESLLQARRQLHKQSFLDPLTELPSRPMFESLLITAGGLADREGRNMALLVINLDGFKQLNESFGHDHGDLLLREMARRLRGLARATDTVARLGADEFLLLMPGDLRREEVTRMAAKVLEALGQPCMVGNREAVLSCSIGIALYPEHGAATALISHGEMAMRAAKGTGGAAYSFFEAHMARGIRDQMELLRDLRVALAGGQLSLVYQPKIHAPSGEITGAEALMRWNHPERGLVSPAVFIPIAERFGLIGSLGSWLIEEACRQIRVWRDEGLRMRVAINLSVHQLRQSDLPERIQEALQRWKVNPNLLTCEITETVAMEDIQATQKVFQRLAEVGVHISIDDFGTGYSSLAYLRRLPAEELKIDRSFVNDLATSADARAVVDAVVKLAQALGLKLVAEGVETEEQHQILRTLGCHELQGYLFARPMPAKALGLWAMNDVGPAPMGFRHSLFEETNPMPLG